MWHFGTQFSNEYGSAELMDGLNDLKDLFQPKQFCDLFPDFQEVKSQLCSSAHTTATFDKQQ